MSNLAVALPDDGSELSCIVIPTTNDALLLPNVCVAEILPWRRIQSQAEGPRWLVGMMSWRGLTLPVLEYAGFDDQSKDLPTRWNCLVVMNRARSSTGPAFYALAASTMPRMMQLVNEDLSDSSVDEALAAADVMKVQLGTEIVTIPDLEYLESSVRELNLEQ